jgi:hypothetical protein
VKKIIFILTLMLVAYIFNAGNVSVFAVDNQNIGGTIRDIDPADDPRTARDHPPNCSDCASPTPNPTTVQPSPTSGGGSGGVPTQSPSSDSGSSSDDDPCGPGKSYTGQYCGWSPEKDKPSSSDSGGSSSEGPSVLGLSATSGSDLTASDIMLLTGTLCLLLYVRSKTNPIRSL